MGKVTRKSILTTFLFILTLLFFNVNLVKADVNEEGYEIKVSHGIEGKFKANKYIPIEVEVTSMQEDFTGEVEIRTDTNEVGKYDAYIKSISVDKGKSEKVIIPIIVPENSARIEVNLNRGKDTILTKSKLVSKGRINDNNFFLGTLSEDRSALGYINNVLYQENMKTYGFTTIIENVNLDENIILDNKLNIDGLDVILINNYNLGNFKKEHYDALNSWVSSGGTLVISAGANEGKTIKNINKEFLNVTSSGYKEANIDLLGENINLINSTLEIKEGEVIIESNNIPLAYSVKRGKGEIIITSFDLGLEPFISSSKASEFIKVILKNTEKRLVAYQNGKMMPIYYGANNITNSVPVEKIVSFETIVGIVAIYAVIVGFLLYYILKKLNKRDLTWIFVPAISIIFTIIIFFVGSSTRVKDVILNQNNIVDINKDGTASVVGYLGIGTKYRNSLNINNPLNLSLSPLNTDHYYFPEEESKSKILRLKTVYEGNNKKFSLENNSALDMKSFKIIGNNQVFNKIENNLYVDGNKLSGTIKNTLGYDIRNLIFVSNSSIWELGSLKKDEEKTIENQSVTVSYGLQGYGGSLAQKYYDTRFTSNGDVSGEEYKNILRNATLFDLASQELNNSNYKLIGITDMPIDYELNFDNKSLSKYDSTVIAQDVELTLVEKDGIVSYPEGYFKGIVDSYSSTVYYQNHNNSFYGNGEVFMNYEIDRNLEVTEIGLRNVQLYDYMQSTLDSYIYNYKTGEYEKLAIGTKFVTLNNLKDYLEGNILKVKIVVNDSKGETGVPIITVKGRDK